MKKRLVPMLALAAMLGFGIQARAQMPLASDDQQFMEQAAQGNMAEVQLGQTAVQKAEHPAVKGFAQRMVQDHGTAQQQLTAMATHLNAVLPQSVSPEHQATHDRLAALSGHDFDTFYMQEMVRDHQLDLNAYREAAARVTNPQIKQYIARTIPILEDHLRQAQMILREETAIPTRR